MMLSLIVAMDESGGIGREGKIPWHLSGDLKRFKALTMGHHLIMGRKTFESIGQPLPGRTNVIITRDIDYQQEGCLVVHSLHEAMALAEQRGERDAFIIGGGEIFAQAFSRADRFYLTRIHADTGADVFFPKIRDNDWQVVYQETFPAGKDDQYPSTFMILSRPVNFSPD